jgi:hypothetical protein
MESLLMLVVIAVLGGIILALLLGSRWIDLRSRGIERPLESTSPSLINMAHIPVRGGGGLGIVAAVIAVALADPRIRVAIGIAALLGVVLAAVLIARRRERGPLSSGGGDSASPSMLGLGRDQPDRGLGLGRDQPGRAPVRSNGGRNHLSEGHTGAAGFRLAAGH